MQIVEGAGSVNYRRIEKGISNYTSFSEDHSSSNTSPKRKVMSKSEVGGAEDEAVKRNKFLLILFFPRI
jgi:DNA-binding GntR family transcriptional regulator